jgi:hypothetical protein
MAREIKHIDDVQAELLTLRTLLRLAFHAAHEIPYPEAETMQRRHDEVTSILQVVLGRLADLETSVDRSVLPAG